MDSTMMYSLVFIAFLPFVELSMLTKFIQQKMTKYNKLSPPHRTNSVKLVVHLEELKEINDIKETVVTRVRTNIWWYDDRLKWIKNKFWTNKIILPSNEIWKPDIALLNGVTELTSLGASVVPVRVQADGKIEWTPINIFETKCRFDLEFYPFDIQYCVVKIGTLTSTKIFIKFLKMECTKGDKSLETSTWKLIRVNSNITLEIVNSVLNTKQQVLTCEYHLQRKGSFYFFNILLPLLFLGIMNPLAFLIPNDSGEKISFCMALFLTFAVFVTIVMDKVPVNSDKISRLQMYLITQLAITVFILVVTVLQVRFSTITLSVKQDNKVRPTQTKSKPEENHKPTATIGQGNIWLTYNVSSHTSLQEDPRTDNIILDSIEGQSIAINQAHDLLSTCIDHDVIKKDKGTVRCKQMLKLVLNVLTITKNFILLRLNVIVFCSVLIMQTFSTVWFYRSIIPSDFSV